MIETAFFYHFERLHSSSERRKGVFEHAKVTSGKFRLDPSVCFAKTAMILEFVNWAFKFTPLFAAI